jgi:hypothetical protein
MVKNKLKRNKGLNTKILKKSKENIEIQFFQKDFEFQRVNVFFDENNWLTVEGTIFYSSGESGVFTIKNPYRLDCDESYNETEVSLNLSSGYNDKTTIELDSRDHSEDDGFRSITLKDIDWNAITEFLEYFGTEDLETNLVDLLPTSQTIEVKAKGFCIGCIDFSKKMGYGGINFVELPEENNEEKHLVWIESTPEEQFVFGFCRDCITTLSRTELLDRYRKYFECVICDMP